MDNNRQDAIQDRFLRRLQLERGEFEILKWLYAMHGVLCVYRVPVAHGALSWWVHRIAFEPFDPQKDSGFDMITGNEEPAP